MNCTEAKTHCQRFLDRQVENPLSLEIEAHLAACPVCAGAYDSQRAFHALLKKALCQATASGALRTRVQQQLDDERLYAAPAGTAPPRALVRAHAISLQGPVAAAASVMLALSGIVAFQSSCVLKQCPLVMAAAHEHDNIVAQSAQRIAAAEPGLTRKIEARLKSLGNFPKLTNCHLKPVNCGMVRIAGLPEGMYIQYAHCTCDSQPVTLMVVKTTDAPGGEQITEKFRVANHANHSIVSWHDKGDSMLYILVTKLPSRNALEVAELAQN